MAIGLRLSRATNTLFRPVHERLASDHLNRARTHVHPHATGSCALPKSGPLGTIIHVVVGLTGRRRSHNHLKLRIDPRSGRRFGRQETLRQPPPEISSGLVLSGIVHHLSASQTCALKLRHFHKWNAAASPGLRPARDGTGIPNAADLRRPVLSFRARGLFKDH
ncbi:hypothetical protein JTE90_023060 [Oedothorax gibbosus]|uniref:Uncharacterized protein n=1 Tax=Oedothorax gibbosus TaxID=931172 RepID=A0AAV6TJV3_9ARAC|nr:hypothetical protein JTE90_023060 [Oedothorax gibbosus]